MLDEVELKMLDKVDPVKLLDVAEAELLKMLDKEEPFQLLDVAEVEPLKMLDLDPVKLLVEAETRQASNLTKSSHFPSHQFWVIIPINGAV